MSFEPATTSTIDTSTIGMTVLGILLAVAVIYILYREKAGSWGVQTINGNVLIERMKEFEEIFVKIKASPCWKCNGTEKEIFGNLYGIKNVIKIKCKQCGTEVEWKKGDTEWKAQTNPETVTAELADEVNKSKNRKQ